MRERSIGDVRALLVELDAYAPPLMLGNFLAPPVVGVVELLRTVQRRCGPSSIDRKKGPVHVDRGHTRTKCGARMGGGARRLTGTSRR
jgi:hypothetical protein